MKKFLAVLASVVASSVFVGAASADEMYYQPVPGYACQMGAMAPGWGVQYDARWRAIGFVHEFGGRGVHLASGWCVTVVVHDGGGFADRFVRAPRWMVRRWG